MTGFARFHQKPPKDPNANISPQENSAQPSGDEGDGFDDLDGLNQFGIDDGILTNNDYGVDDDTNGDFGFLGGDFGGIDDAQDNFDEYNLDFGRMGSEEAGEMNITNQHVQAMPANNNDGGGVGISFFQKRHGERPIVDNDDPANRTETSPAMESTGQESSQNRIAYEDANTSRETIPDAPQGSNLANHLQAPSHDHQHARASVPRTYQLAATPPATPIALNRTKSLLQIQASIQGLKTPPMNHPTNTFTEQHVTKITLPNTVTPMNTTTNKTQISSPFCRTVLPMPVSEKKTQVPAVRQVMAPPAPRPATLSKPNNLQHNSLQAEAVSQQTTAPETRTERLRATTVPVEYVGLIKDVRTQRQPRNEWNHFSSELSPLTQDDEHHVLQAMENSFVRSVSSPKDATFQNAIPQDDSFRPEHFKTQQLATNSLPDTSNTTGSHHMTIKPLTEMSFEELFAAFDSNFTSACDKDKAFQRGYIETRLSVGATTARVLKLQALEAALTMDIASDIAAIDKLLSGRSE